MGPSISSYQWEKFLPFIAARCSDWAQTRAEQTVLLFSVCISRVFARKDEQLEALVGPLTAQATSRVECSCLCQGIWSCERELPPSMRQLGVLNSGLGLVCPWDKTKAAGNPVGAARPCTSALRHARKLIGRRIRERASSLLQAIKRQLTWQHS